MKSRTKFTPGPWIWVRDFSCWLIASEENVGGVAFTYPRGRTNSARGRADAQLIAAAPEMYDALGRCISALAANGVPNCEAVKEAKRAIAKARGAK